VVPVKIAARSAGQCFQPQEQADADPDLAERAAIAVDVAVARTDPGLARRVVAYLPEPHQRQVGRVICDGA